MWNKWRLCNSIWVGHKGQARTSSSDDGADVVLTHLESEVPQNSKDGDTRYQTGERVQRGHNHWVSGKRIKIQNWFSIFFLIKFWLRVIYSVAYNHYYLTKKCWSRVMLHSTWDKSYILPVYILCKLVEWGEHDQCTRTRGQREEHLGCSCIPYL